MATFAISVFCILIIVTLLPVAGSGTTIWYSSGSCEAFTDKRLCRRSLGKPCQWDKATSLCFPKPCKDFHDIETCREYGGDTCIWLADRAKCKTYKGLGSIQNASSPWDEGTAAMQIQNDLSRLIARYRDRLHHNRAILDAFIATREKDTGILQLAQWGTVGKLLQYLPRTALGTHEGALMQIEREVAEMLKSAYVSSYSYVEGTVMRGWPMHQKPDTKYAVHEAYEFGRIGQAIAMAAKTAAKARQYGVAVDLLKPVLEQLYDSFLGGDTRKMKLDGQGRLVLVPNTAPPDRLNRYLEVYDYPICLDRPQTYSHGTSPARAAIEVLQTIDLIDWNSENVTWPLAECPLESCRKRIAQYVKRTAEWMRSAFQVQRPYLAHGGDKGKDKYPGLDNSTTWYTWRHQDTSGCNKDARAPYLDESSIGTSEFVDRPQDILHAKEEMAFIHEHMAWAASDSNPIAAASAVFTRKDIRRLMVTFLNRVVYNYTADGLSRQFACDVEGRLTGKLCDRSRSNEGNSQAAINWLVLARAAKDEGLAEPDQTSSACDMYHMVKAVMPLATGPWSKEFDPASFGKMSEDWTSDAILAKYQFYNYDYGLREHCRTNDSESRTANIDHDEGDGDHDDRGSPLSNEQHQQVPSSSKAMNLCKKQDEEDVPQLQSWLQDLLSRTHVHQEALTVPEWVELALSDAGCSTGSSFDGD